MRDVVIRGWFIFLFVSFAVSTLAMSYVQTRVLKLHGWRWFYDRAFFDIYWRELSPLLRWLLWPGLVAFGLTFVGLAVLLAVERLR